MFLWPKENTFFSELIFITQRPFMHPKNVQSYFIIKLLYLEKILSFLLTILNIIKGIRQRSIIFLWSIHLNKQYETKYDRLTVFIYFFFAGQSKFNNFSFRISWTKPLLWWWFFRTTQKNVFFPYIFLLRYWPSSTHRLLVYCVIEQYTIECILVCWIVEWWGTDECESYGCLFGSLM